MLKVASMPYKNKREYGRVFIQLASHVYSDEFLNIYIDIDGPIDRLSNGNIYSVGGLKFNYFMDGRIYKIGNSEFNYFMDGRIYKIGSTEFNYYLDGRIYKIGDTRYE